MDIGTAKPTKKDQKAVPHHMLDLIEPGKRYSTYRFKADALKLVDDIRRRGHIPFIVGGSGLYIYSILFDYDFDQKTRCDKIIPNCVAVGIEVDKNILRDRIKSRFQAMLDAGLEDEFKKLVKKYGTDTLQLKRNCYGEVQKYLRGELTRTELIKRAEIIDWQLAKKQRTWFSQKKDQIKWLPLDEAEKYLVKALQK